MKTKTFDCVHWVRETRDANYNNYKELSPREFSKQLSLKAQKSALWARFNKIKVNEKS